MTPDQVLHDLTFLSQLIDMDEYNATKLGRLQSVLDMNNITAIVALQEVSGASRFFTIASKLSYKRLLLSANGCHGTVCRTTVLKRKKINSPALF
jgi:hypothetical protein